MCLESYPNQKKILQYVSLAYQAYQGKSYLDPCEQQFLHLIDQCLDSCSQSTKWIIQFDFFEKKARDWYLNYFAKSSYYRLKKVAINEFLNCLEVS